MSTSDRFLLSIQKCVRCRMYTRYFTQSWMLCIDNTCHISSYDKKTTDETEQHLQWWFIPTRFHSHVKTLYLLWDRNLWVESLKEGNQVIHSTCKLAVGCDQILRKTVCSLGTIWIAWWPNQRQRYFRSHGATTVRVNVLWQGRLGLWCHFSVGSNVFLVASLINVGKNSSCQAPKKADAQAQKTNKPPKKKRDTLCDLDTLWNFTTSKSGVREQRLCFVDGKRWESESRG